MRSDEFIPLSLLLAVNVIDLEARDGVALLVYLREGPWELGGVDENLAVVVELPDPRAYGVDHERPAHIPPWAVSLAAARMHGAPSLKGEYNWAWDARLVRWWKIMRALGLLPPELPPEAEIPDGDDDVR